MARGWEKEDVDEPKAPRPAGTPTPADVRAAAADRTRRVQGLELQRERILSERTSSPHRRSALAAALLEVEEQLSQLGWTIHI